MDITLKRVDDSWYTRIPGCPERVSAGGVVLRLEKGGLWVALVREVGVEGYVIPKGGVEPGESIDEAALREIAEEAGITQLTKIGYLGTLERMSEKKIYWSINHYNLYLTEQREGQILDTEHHFDFGWFPIEEPPVLFWPDEKRLLIENRAKMYDAVIQHQNPRPRKKYFM